MNTHVIAESFRYSLLIHSFARLQPVCLLSPLRHVVQSKVSFRSYSRRAYISATYQDKMFDKIIKNPCAEVIVVPVLSDNFSYILVDKETKDSFCVDPAEPAKVVARATEKGLKLSAAFCTHKHYDHSGGNTEIKRLVDGIHVYGSSYEAVPGLTETLVHQQTLKFGANLEIKCIKAACHTIGHMLYYVSNPSNPDLQPILFTGDTVFIGGCGRFFEGDAPMMLDIVNNLKRLPTNTLIYCGHEYTVRNMEFAKTVDDSKAVDEKLHWAEKARMMGIPTVPSLLGQELEYNPFFRAAALMETVNESTEEGALAKLRKLKDRF